MVRGVLFCRRVNQLKAWSKNKGKTYPEKYEERQRVLEERRRQNRQLRIADYKSQLDHLEEELPTYDADATWSASVVFAVLCELIDSLSKGICLTLMQVNRCYMSVSVKHMNTLFCLFTAGLLDCGRTHDQETMCKSCLQHLHKLATDTQVSTTSSWKNTREYFRQVPYFETQGLQVDTSEIVQTQEGRG